MQAPEKRSSLATQCSSEPTAHTYAPVPALVNNPNRPDNSWEDVLDASGMLGIDPFRNQHVDPASACTHLLAFMPAWHRL